MALYWAYKNVPENTSVPGDRDSQTMDLRPLAEGGGQFGKILYIVSFAQMWRIYCRTLKYLYYYAYEKLKTTKHEVTHNPVERGIAPQEE